MSTPILTASWSDYPRRIVCLTEETTETLYLLGEGDRVVGISGYTVRPSEARKKPKVSAFISAKFDKIVELKPDLVFAFCDLQADIAAELIRRGITVLTFNQRSIQEILDMILMIGRIVGCPERAVSLVTSLRTELDQIKESAARFKKRPRVMFEEWYDPLISGIRWVEELIEIAGGETIFPELRIEQSAKGRIIDPAKVIQRDPEIIIASWCGRTVRKNLINERAGYQNISAVKNGYVYEIKSTYILQPGPIALTEGVRQIHALLAHAVGCSIESSRAPNERLDIKLNADMGVSLV